ncbi:MAG: hypothetical protein AW07_04142 [Candidatus Accumulibacter sp. SK-11]|nr:MAG: hypothetical protein AW07_04142 [Candidatus Accumulibacter sp. SK-11]
MGVAKLQLAANITPTTKGRGSTPNCWAIPITTGVNSTATALLLRNSVAIEVMRITSDSSIQGDRPPPNATSCVASSLSRPELCMAMLIASMPKISIRMGHSMDL